MGLNEEGSGAPDGVVAGADGAADQTSGAVPMVLAADGGGTKTDVLAVGLDGRVLASATGGPARPADGEDRVVARLGELFTAAREQAGGGPVVRTAAYLAGFDLPEEFDSFARSAAGAWWLEGEAGAALFDNDAFAMLRAGTRAHGAVAIVCGTGVNCVGRCEDRLYRIPALGRYTGDWGGGDDIGEEAMFHACRAVDGRGGPTALVEVLPAALGRACLAELVADLHFGRLEPSVIGSLAPTVFAASDAGDGAARDIVLRQAREVVTMATAALRELDLLAEPTPVVFGGGVLAGRNPVLMEAITRDLAERAPKAEVVFLERRPVVGAGLLALEAAGAGEAAVERLENGG